MANLKDSKTDKNLLEAFAGESMARNKYTYFASKARKQGFEQIAAIFEETAGNEKEHAKLWFKYLCCRDIPTAAENLRTAAGEMPCLCTPAGLFRAKARQLLSNLQKKRALHWVLTGAVFPV